jgi:hypothetical protein
MNWTPVRGAVRLHGSLEMRGFRPRVIPPGAARPCPIKGHRVRDRILRLAGAITAASLASPATAMPETSTRVVRCGGQSCLRIAGHRDDPASIVRINVHAVPVEGKRSWKVDLPVEVVREWSLPNARTIDVSLGDLEMKRESADSVDLPIGLFANATVLATLAINVR